MTSYVILTDKNFEEEVVQSELPVLVDFWAEWCMPCKMIAPIVEEIATELAGKLKVGKIDVDSNSNSSMKYGIRSIPTLLIFKDGNAVEQITGAVPKASLLEKIQPYL
jgi:thioredoxin 1